MHVDVVEPVVAVDHEVVPGAAGLVLAPGDPSAPRRHDRRPGGREDVMALVAVVAAPGAEPRGGAAHVAAAADREPVAVEADPGAARLHVGAREAAAPAVRRADLERVRPLGRPPSREGAVPVHLLPAARRRPAEVPGVDEAVAVGRAAVEPHADPQITGPADGEAVAGAELPVLEEGRVRRAGAQQRGAGRCRARRRAAGGGARIRFAHARLLRVRVGRGSGRRLRRGRRGILGAAGAACGEHHDERRETRRRARVNGLRGDPAACAHGQGPETSSSSRLRG